MDWDYATICSGIESASVAWEPLGLKPLWFSEIEPFPCAVLKHHWPLVPNLGDMNNIADAVRMGLVPAPSIICGGTPCQAFSIAGDRKSLGDDRGQLTLTYVDLINAIDEQREDGDECIAAWENVPGVLSTYDNAFGCFLGELSGHGESLEPGERAELGKSNKHYKWNKKTQCHRTKWSNAGCVFGPKRAVAWRVIDAQFFGVAQRRKRVFLVTSAIDGFDPTKILFESEGVRRDIAPSREQGEKVTNCITSGIGNADGDTQCDNLIWPSELASTLNASFGDKLGLENQHIDSGAPLFVAHGIPGNWIGRKPENGGNSMTPMDNISPCLTSTDRHCVSRQSGTRRLMPVECGRLQGFPDGHTDVPYNKKPAKDGPRYKAIGNSKAVPCIQWLGARIICYKMGLL